MHQVNTRNLKMDSWKEVPFGNHHFQLPFVKMSAYNPLPPRGENEVRT